MLAKLFIEHVRRNHLFSRSDRLFIAVSGGVDSVVLCHLCFVNGLAFEMAHVNFGLRGDESDGDEQFVRQIASHFGVKLHVLKADTAAHAAAKKISIQVAARELRYSWFDGLLTDKAGWLLTAHHADDN